MSSTSTPARGMLFPDGDVQTVVCIDPGKHVGVVVLVVNDDHYTTSTVELDWSKLDDRKVLYALVNRADTVVVEDFVPDYRTPYLKGKRLWAVEVIGATIALTDLLNVDLVRVLPQKHKSIAAAVAQRVIGKPTSNRHAFDAGRLATWWLVSERKHPQALEIVKTCIGES